MLLLQRGQRINVLDVGRDLPVWRPRCDRSPPPGELDQRQHLRGDRRTSGQDAVGWNLYLRRGQLDGSRQCCQGGGRREDGAHIDREALAPHAFDQSDGEQGVTAEFEEVIVPSDTFQLEQLSPDAGQGGLCLPLGLFIALAGIGIAVRSGQRLAVQLAVGGQR